MTRRERRTSFRAPQVAVLQHESFFIPTKLCAASALAVVVAIDVLAQSRVRLIEVLEQKRREHEPRRGHARALADAEVEAADRKSVGGGTEVEIDVETRRDVGGIDVDFDRTIAHPALHAHPSRFPRVVARDLVLETAHVALHREDGVAGDVATIETHELMSRPLQASPQE